MSTVKYTVDPQKPPRMSKAEQQRLEAMRDEDIDYSDIPELDADFWEHARIATPSTKANVSLRVSEDVLAFFKADSPKLDFVHFSGPDPEDAFVGDEHEGVVQRHGDSAKIVGVFPFASM